MNLVEKILEEALLTERRNIGKLYHFTSGWALMGILEGNEIKAHVKFYKLSDNSIDRSKPEIKKYAVSTTRDGNFLRTGKRNISGMELRIELDSVKLSDHYKITPFNDQITMSGSGVARSKRNNESEEAVWTPDASGIKNALNYILNVVFYLKGGSQFGEVAALLEQKNIPYTVEHL